MPEDLLLVVWSSIGLWVVCWVGLLVHSFYFAFAGLGWVGLKKLDPRTTLILPKELNDAHLLKHTHVTIQEHSVRQSVRQLSYILCTGFVGL